MSDIMPDTTIPDTAIPITSPPYNQGAMPTEEKPHNIREACERARDYHANEAQKYNNALAYLDSTPESELHYNTLRDIVGYM